MSEDKVFQTGYNSLCNLDKSISINSFLYKRYFEHAGSDSTHRRLSCVRERI